MREMMKIDARELNKALGTAMKWVPSRPIVDATGGFLLEDDGVLNISAIDLGTGSDISIRLDAEGDLGKSAFSVNAKKLAPVVASMAKRDEEIALATTKSRLSVKQGSHTVRLALTDASEFPELFREEADRTTKLNPEALLAGITTTRAAADPNNPTPHLGGIHFANDNAVAVDGFRIIIMRNVPMSEDPITIPTQACVNLEAVLSSAEWLTLHEFNGMGKVMLEWDKGITSAATLAAEKFPEYELLLPKKWDTEIILPRDELIYSLTLARPFASEVLGLVTLIVAGPDLTLASRASSGSNKSHVDTIEKHGPDVTVGISYRYLLDAVTKMPGTIYMRLNGPTSMIVITNDDDCTYGIMPMEVT
jgi:DNA polymerase-3 subunit beta